jgi:uncharacterized protein YjbJ (UPF0337 family)
MLIAIMHVLFINIPNWSVNVLFKEIIVNNNEHNVSDSWHEMKVRIKSKWGHELSNREINKIKGKKDKLLGTLINKFDLTLDEAEKEIDKFWH